MRTSQGWSFATRGTSASLTLAVSFILLRSAMVRILVPGLFMVPTTTSSPTSALSTVMMPSIAASITVLRSASRCCSICASAAARLFSSWTTVFFCAWNCASRSRARVVASSYAWRLMSPARKSDSWRCAVALAFSSVFCVPTMRERSASRR